MKKKTKYTFLLTTGFRTPDIEAYNPKQAYKIASQQSYKLILTKAYEKFDRDGFAIAGNWKHI